MCLAKSKCALLCAHPVQYRTLCVYYTGTLCAGRPSLGAKFWIADNFPQNISLINPTWKRNKGRCPWNLPESWSGKNRRRRKNWPAKLQKIIKTTGTFSSLKFFLIIWCWIDPFCSLFNEFFAIFVLLQILSQIWPHAILLCAHCSTGTAFCTFSALTQLGDNLFTIRLTLKLFLRWLRFWRKSFLRWLSVSRNAVSVDSA